MSKTFISLARAPKVKIKWRFFIWYTLSEKLKNHQKILDFLLWKSTKIVKIFLGAPPPNPRTLVNFMVFILRFFICYTPWKISKNEGYWNHEVLSEYANSILNLNFFQNLNFFHFFWHIIWLVCRVITNFLLTQR